MKDTKTIGDILRRIRRDKLWTLQRTCDLADNIIDTGYLSRIENNKSVPSVTVAYYIAKALGVKIEDIYNEIEGRAIAPAGYEDKVPVLSWVRAGAICSSPTHITPETCESWIPAPRRNIKSSSYALKVRGDSMQSLNGMSFPDGCYIIIDPEKEAVDKSYVVAMTRDTEESTFKQLVRDGGKYLLKPLNPQYPIITATEDMIICGVVTDMVAEIL